ncbi:MAG: hypothetical protein LUI15_01150 [Firmicutes bacterium]|nr:hypothetical protein [Bacillota bacterium]
MDKLNLGVIGLGSRGYSVLVWLLLGMEDVNVTVVCDVYEDRARAGQLLGVGGTIRAVSSVLNHLFSRSDDCKIISAEEIRMLLKRMEKPDGDILHELLKIIPDRVHTIVPGLTVLEAVTRATGAEDITVSRCGVREGYLVKSVLKG